MYTVQVKHANSNWVTFKKYRSEIQAIAGSLNKKTHDGTLTVRILDPNMNVIYTN